MINEKKYVPFGEEWEKEINKISKKFLIEMLRKAFIEIQNQGKEIENLKHQNELA